MKNFDIHFCLASESSITNITPTLNQLFKPKKVVVLYYQALESSVENMFNVLHKHGIKTKKILIDNCWDVVLIMEQVDKYLLSLKNKSIALNISGGTKPMVLAAQNVFSKYSLTVFYVNEKTDEIVFFPNKDNKETELVQIEDRLTLNDYLQSFGIKTRRRLEAQPFSKTKMLLCYKIIANIHEFKDSLIILNRYAAQSEPKVKKKLAPKDVNNPTFMKLLRLFVESNLCVLSGNKLKFSSHENKFFCNGGWLEEYVFWIIQELKHSLPIQDVDLGIDVITSNNSSNEIDVVFVANNRFFLIECKTENYNSSYGKKKALNIIYKLDSLKDYAGLRTKAMLVSFYKVPSASINRAKDYDIQVVEHKTLKNLKDILLNWITKD